MVSRIFDYRVDCPIYPIESITFRTNITWTWVQAKKHISVSQPKIKCRILCDNNIETKNRMDIGICPENNIMKKIFNKPDYRKELIKELHRMGVPQIIVRPPGRAPFSKEKEGMTYCKLMVIEWYEKDLDKYR